MKTHIEIKIKGILDETRLTGQQFWLQAFAQTFSKRLVSHVAIRFQRKKTTQDLEIKKIHRYFTYRTVGMQCNGQQR